MTLRPPSSSPEGSSVLAAFRAQDFYGNSISERWGDGAFQAWSFASVGNLTAANVYDDGNGSYRVVSDATEDTGTAFLFVERDGLGIPGSPFEVICLIENCRGRRPGVGLWHARSCMAAAKTILYKDPRIPIRMSVDGAHRVFGRDQRQNADMSSCKVPPF